MSAEEYTIGQVADELGLSRRAIRFYIQRKLIAAPTGVGRGRHYGPEHLSQLRRILDLQAAGHSLEEIRQIQAGKPALATGSPSRAHRGRTVIQARLWTRVQLAEGIELNFDARRFSPAVEDLAKLRDMIQAAFGVTRQRNDVEEDNQREGPEVQQQAGDEDKTIGGNDEDRSDDGNSD